MSAATLASRDVAADDPAHTGGSWFTCTPLRVRGEPLAYWVFLLYLFLASSYVDEEWPALGALRLKPLAGAAVLALVLGQAALRALVPARLQEPGPDPEGPRLRAAPGAWWLLLFLVAGFLSCVWSYAPDRSLPAQIEHTQHVLVFFVAWFLLTSRSRIVMAILVLCAAYGVYLVRAFLEYRFAGKHDFTMGVSRMLGTGQSYADPNSFAATVVFGLVLVIWVGLHARSPIMRACAVAYFILGSVSAIHARSRSGFILLSLAVIWTFFSIPSRRMKVVLAAAVAILAVALVGVQSKAALERFSGIFSAETYSRDSSTHGRIEGYQVSWQIFQRKPLFGVGQRNWGLYRARHVDGNQHEPHTLGGQLIATRGLAGTVTFLGFLIATIAFAFRVRRERKGVTDPWARAVAGLASLVVMTLALLFVSGLAAHNLDRPQWYLTPALLAAAALHTARRDPAPPIPDEAA